MDYQVAGRRLLVEFTCGRCGITQRIPYVENPACSAYANLRDHEVPGGWQVADAHLPMLCPQCVNAFKRFMDGTLITPVEL